MDADKEREAHREKLESLQYTHFLVSRVLAHAKYVEEIPFGERNILQRLWYLAYEAAEIKMTQGSDDSESHLYEGGFNIRTLAETIEYAQKEPRAPENQRHGFSLFGRSRSKR